MMIFLKSQNMKSVSLALPADKILAIRQVGEKITIKVYSGENEALSNETNGTVASPVTDYYTVKYSDADAAEREMYAFYKAIVEGKQAFLFSDEPESFEKF